MAQLELDAVRTGMVLKADVTNGQGHTLLRAGVGLSARHLQLLRAQGIAEVCVEEAAQAVGSTQSESAKRPTTSIKERFRHNDPRHPLISELMRLCEERPTPVSAVVENS